MYELIYKSVAAKDITNQTINGILKIARIKNSALEISGMLVFDGSNFFQILEGEEDAVNGIYSQIKNDKRHHSIDFYHAGFISERSFSDWSMSYKLLAESSSISGWIEWLDAQNIIQNISRTDSLGCRIFKLAFNI